MAMEIDHILPVSLGGATVESNLWPACSECNQTKGNRVAAFDPETGELVRLFNPRDERWSEHFAWTADGDLIIGKTPIGRATILALSLNRTSQVRARRAWVAVGWHPPSDI